MVTVVGVVGAVVGAIMVLMFAFSDAFGLNTSLARWVVLGVLVVAIVWYWIANPIRSPAGSTSAMPSRRFPPE